MTFKMTASSIRTTNVFVRFRFGRVFTLVPPWRMNSRLISTDVSIARIEIFVKQQKKIFRKVATDFVTRCPEGVVFGVEITLVGVEVVDMKGG